MQQLFVGSIVLMLCALGWGTGSFGQERPTPRGELRIVDRRVGNWQLITAMVFEHLMERDQEGTLVPRLATSWRWLDDRTLEVMLRQGVTFHNGEVFDAEIVKLNWEENTKLQQPHLVGGFMSFAPESRLEILDPWTVRFVFPESDGGAMAKLLLLHMGNRQFYRDLGWGEKHWWILDAAGPWGTGPYKLVEGFSTPEKRSDRVVLEANLAYWDHTRLPRLHRIVFDNTLGQKEAVELVKTEEGRVDLVTELSPLETLQVAESPFATVVKNRGAPTTMYGVFNMRKTGSPWGDVRLRQAVNYAINREDLIRYAAKGNGVIIPALVPPQGLGYAPDLAPYPFKPAKTRELLREAGYPHGLSLTLIAAQALEIQATVVSKMLEQAGFTVDLQVLDADTYNSKTNLSLLEQPAEQQQWDLALRGDVVSLHFPQYNLHRHALSGPTQWVFAAPELHQLYDQVLRTVDQEQQRGLIRQMERHTAEQAYFLFLYSPIPLYAVNKEVVVVPHLGGWFTEISVTEQHWSVRKQKTAGHE